MNLYKNVKGTPKYNQTYRGRSRDDQKVRVRINRRGIYQNRLVLTNEEEIIVPRRFSDKQGRPLPIVPTILQEEEPVYDLPDESAEPIKVTLRKDILKHSKGIQTEAVLDAEAYDDVAYPLYRNGSEKDGATAPYEKWIATTESRDIKRATNKPPVPPRKPITFSKVVQTISGGKSTTEDNGRGDNASLPPAEVNQVNVPSTMNEDEYLDPIIEQYRMLKKFMQSTNSHSNHKEERSIGNMPYDQLMHSNDGTGLMEDEEVVYLCRKQLRLEQRSKKDQVKIKIQRENIELLKACRENRKTWMELKKKEREINADIENITEGSYGQDCQNVTTNDEEDQQTAVKEISAEIPNIEEYYYWTPRPENIREDTCPGENESSHATDPENDDDFLDLK